MKKLIFVIIPLFIVLVLVTSFYNFYKFAKPTAEIKGHKFQLLIARSDEDKQTGLSKYKSLPQDQGMLFVFDKKGIYSFWMKDMKFPLDIIFIKDNKIVTIYQNLPVNNLAIHSPTEDVDKVLEINANLSKDYGLSVNDTVIFKNLK